MGKITVNTAKNLKGFPITGTQIRREFLDNEWWDLYNVGSSEMPAGFSFGKQEGDVYG